MEKYDRQIRLFGIETQKKLKNLKILIKSKKSFIAAEILKNLVLLGVEHFTVDTNVIEMYYKLVPTRLEDINKDVKIETGCELKNGIDCNQQDIRKNSDDCKISRDFDFSIYVDKVGKGIYVCSSCLMYDFDSTCDCIGGKSAKPAEEHNLPRECLLGSILVQEIVKNINGDKVIRKYKLEI